MSSTGNEAEGKRPSVEEEMAKFKTVSFKNGEVSNGESDDNADQMARENRAGEANRRSHAENQAAGPVDTGEGAEGEKGGKQIELTDEEKDAALAAAEEKEGAELSDEEKDAVLAATLASKVRTAAVAARKAAKAARYDDNHKARRAAEKENGTLRRQLETMQRQLDTLAAGKPLTDGKPAVKDAVGKPDSTDAKYQYGELDPKYMADLARHEATEALRAENERQNTTRQTAAEAAKAEEMAESREAFAEAGEEIYDDFREVVMENGLSKDNPGGWPCSTVIADLLVDSDHGAEIAYELASNIPEARRVAKMSGPRQAIWFGQQEAKLSAESAALAPKPKEKPAAGAPAGNANTGKVRESRAPAPLSRLSGSGGNRVPDGATTDFRSFEAAAMAPPKR